jgi:NADPH:quinone reductase-like Zn-dependent oxidoreductase
MRAVLYKSYGERPMLEHIARPRPGQGQVLIRSEAAALNPLDVKLHSGAMQWYFTLSLPYVLGSDVSGIVAELGSGVTQFSVGDAVIGRAPPMLGGALADYVVVEATACIARPAAISATEGAAIPTAAGTAWHALFDIAKVSEGKVVLVHAGAGGVGVFAIQFAKLVGARVIATASGDGLALAARLGADQVIDYRSNDFVADAGQVDVVIDPIGGDTQRRSFDVLRKGGCLVSLVEEPGDATGLRQDVTAKRAYYKLEPGGLDPIVAAVANHRLVIPIDTKVPLEEFAMAFDRQASGRARGKIVTIFEPER